MWGLVVLNVCAGWWLSPLTAVRKVRVTGAAVSDRARIQNVLQSWRDVPFARLNVNAVEARLGSRALVNSATFNPNILGRAFVVVQNRVPLARIQNSKACLDRHGVVFLPDEMPESLLQVDTPNRGLLPNAGLCGPWLSSKTAILCELMKAQVPNVSALVEVGSRGGLSFQTESGAEVVLGSSESLPQKIEKLRSLLEEKPDLLNSVRQLNLTYPGSPVVVRG